MKTLGNRLETVLSLIRDAGPFSCLSDVGSDHAFVALSAVREGYAASAVASDIRKGPLERGRANAERLGVPVEFRLSDGLDALGEFRFDCVCICGMGGEMIADILRRAGEKAYCRLFLQPMTAQDDLRRFLWENGFCIGSETYTVERGKPYAVLSVVHTGERTEYTYADLFLGQFRPAESAYADYAAKTLSQAEKRRIGVLSRGEDPAAEDGLIREAQAFLRTYRQ